ncbi:hypothetical protein BJV82DRAFT_626102 [Fennellomyces sp. T-0311]|nr:hypothetical protein BJV82DRAFT_626102 [Fennellomyces sp. T-0311]
MRYASCVCQANKPCIHFPFHSNSLSEPSAPMYHITTQPPFCIHPTSFPSPKEKKTLPTHTPSAFCKYMALFFLLSYLLVCDVGFGK